MQAPEQAEITALAGFDDFVRSVMQDWKLPGLAIAIVKDGQILYTQGFGKRNVAQGLDVTLETLFPIGSCTKAFTTMVMGMLVDEGKLDWDVPVRKYLPTFKLQDAVATERMTPRDLATHRSGLPRHDLVWYRSHHTRQELFDRLQYLEPSKDFRSTWQYQNLMYMTAGYLAGQVAGQSWEQLVQQRILDRLGMKQTSFSVIEAQQTTDFAMPYQEKDDQVHEIPFYEDFEGIAPAGAIVSNVVEMSKWMLLHLNNGKVNDEQLISETQLVQMHSPQMIIAEPRKFKEITHASYTLGWGTSAYRGHYLLQHGGGIDGFSALTTLLPDEKIGIVVLTNMEGCPVGSIVTLNACERLLGLAITDWNERGKKEVAEMKAAQQHLKEQETTDRVPNTHPSHALNDYVGDFAHPGYGTLSITIDGEQLLLRFSDLSWRLQHYHYDVFTGKIERYDLNIKVAFSTNLKGDIDSIAIPFEPLVEPIVFKRVADKEMSDKAFLERFVGEYQFSQILIQVALRGENALFLTVPGQPDYELQPYKDTTFQFKGLSGFSVEFKLDEAGNVTEIVLNQPQGTFTAAKK